MNKIISIGSLEVANDLPMTLIAGPCALESRDHAMEMADALVEMANQKNVSLVFKTSFDKANRSSGSSQRGLGLDKALPIFEEIKNKHKCPTITDVHLPEQCAPVAEIVDILQIPAFLCRQTDLLKAASETGNALHIKKGQFLAPWDMANIVKKCEQFGNENIMLCERGASFGYNTLVNDMRSLPIMKSYGYPVIFDATHSVQQPGGQGTTTGGQREFVEPLARAALAIGVAGVFIETHNDPDKAPSDGPNMVPLRELPALIDKLQAFDHLAKGLDNTMTFKEVS